MDKYALQKVEIRNTIPLAEAEKHYKNITKKKPRKVRESANFYQFRYLPPTKFEKKSFRTKVVNDDIRMVFGKLKEEHHHLEGRGLFDYFTKAYDYVKNKVSDAFDYVKNAVSITDFSTKTKANLDKFGDSPIIALQLRRVPINFAIDLAIQGISAGKWEELKEKYGFDKFYHLSMVATLQDKTTTVVNGRPKRVPKQLAIEKLEVVSVNDNIDVGEGMETQDVPLAGASFTIKDMFQKTRAKVGDTRFFSYSALGANNCQNFIEMLLESEGLYREPERLFVFQDLSQLVKELPQTTTAITQGITHLGALANKYLGIGGNAPVRLNELYRMSGGNQASGFIKAMMARDSASPEEKAEHDRTKQPNAEKFEGLDRRGFKLQEMSKTTHDLARKKKALTRNEAIKRFYDYVIANAPQHQPTSSANPKRNYREAYDLDNMFDRWREEQGVEIREQRRQRREAREEVFPIPEPPVDVRRQHLLELAQRYNTIARANGLGKDEARAVFRQLGGNPRVEGNNKAYRPAREVAQLIVQYANRILNQ